MKQSSLLFPSLLFSGSFMYSLIGFVRFIALLLGREKAMTNLGVPTINIQEQVGFFTSNLILGAYDGYAYVGILIASFALVAGGAYMAWKKERQKVLLICLFLNLLLAVYLYMRF